VRPRQPGTQEAKEHELRAAKTSCAMQAPRWQYGQYQWSNGTTGATAPKSNHQLSAGGSSAVYASVDDG
jgi:hypothetical protein